MKVGILTLPHGGVNYGWALQRWALYKAIEKLGHQPVIIDRRWNPTETGFLRNIKRWFFYNVICHRYGEFIDKEMPSHTELVRSTKSCAEVSKDFDAIIVGSDQVWRIENTRYADMDFFLPFADDKKQIILSYAASFGTDIWSGTKEETEIANKLLDRFKAVSVREDSGVSLCNEIFGKSAYHVLDPTLLLDKNDYNQLLSQPNPRHELVSYILDMNEEKRKLLKNIATDKGLKIVNLYRESIYSYHISVYTWLEKMRDAEYVIVDSFHGMVFSILFEKQFVVLANKKRGLTRFTSLLKQVGLEEHLTTSFNPEIIKSILEIPIDYASVMKKIEMSRDESLDFLKLNLTK